MTVGGGRIAGWQKKWERGGEGGGGEVEERMVVRSEKKEERRCWSTGRWKRICRAGGNKIIQSAGDGIDSRKMRPNTFYLPCLSLAPVNASFAWQKIVS